jgi:hypothetical protein
LCKKNFGNILLNGIKGDYTRLAVWGHREKAIKMRKLTLLSLAMIGILCATLSPATAATSSTSQTVTVTVLEVAELSVSGGNVILNVSSSTAGALPHPVTDNSTSLNWTANRNESSGGAYRNITAQLDTDYTTGIVLRATLSTSCTGGGSTNGSSAGRQTLSGGSAVNMFTGVTDEVCSGATITYDASITSMFPYDTSEAKTVTWTIAEDL